MKRLAVVGTVWHRHSHVDVIVTRWLEPDPQRDRAFGWEGPQTQIAAVYLAQFPENDLGRAMCAKHDLPLCPTIEEALTLGTGQLAVDGVILIGEHGDYPLGELGQQLYPRKEFFDQIIAVFERSGLSVPVFCDKHYSWNLSWATEMVQTARRLGFAFFGGSSVPAVGFDHAQRPGKLAAPTGQPISQGLTTFWVGPETYGFHALEMAQAVLETRPGGESGVAAVTALTGDAVWSALDACVIPADLLDAALAASPNTAAGNMRENCARAAVGGTLGPVSPLAFLVEHRDGLRMWHMMLSGHANDFCLALRLADATWAGRAAMGGPESFYGHFATLDAQIEAMMRTGRACVPPERCLLTTGTVATFLEALACPGERLQTPNLNIAW